MVEPIKISMLEWIWYLKIRAQCTAISSYLKKKNIKKRCFISRLVLGSRMGTQKQWERKPSGTRVIRNWCGKVENGLGHDKGWIDRRVLDRNLFIPFYTEWAKKKSKSITSRGGFLSCPKPSLTFPHRLVQKKKTNIGKRGRIRDQP